VGGYRFQASEAKRLSCVVIRVPTSSPGVTDKQKFEIYVEGHSPEIHLGKVIMYENASNATILMLITHKQFTLSCRSNVSVVAGDGYIARLIYGYPRWFYSRNSSLIHSGLSFPRVKQ